MTETIAPERLRSLIAAVDSTGIAADFVTTYLDMLPGRIRRIQEAVNNSDHSAAMDAVLSLKVTSSMAGAVVLERLCQTLETALRNSLLEEASSIAGRLSGHELPARSALTALLSHHSDK